MWVTSLIDRYKALPVIHVVYIVLAHLISVQSHVCLLKKRPDPSRGGALRWSLPKEDSCRCKRVVAPYMRAMCSGTDEYGDLWFVDEVRSLTMRSNWKKDILDDLLQRTEYCDKERPVMASCGNLETSTNPGQAFATATYKIPNATDNSKVAPSVDCNPPPESEFPVGETNVTCEARDNSGNIATCDFQVIIKDKERPVMASCGNQETSTNPGQAFATATYKIPNATDNSKVAPAVDCNPPPESEFPVGETNVTCEARDNSGNIATFDFQVIIKDKERPVMASCGNLETSTNPGQAFATATYKIPNATDNSKVAPAVDCNPPPESEFPVGETNVTCEARDNSGNIATCDFQVIIKDKERPVMASCGNLETSTNPGQAFATATYKIPNATDNSKVAPSVDCNPPPESEFPVGETNVTCEARDNSGNIATCDFQVIIKDKEPPMISSCPDNYDDVTYSDESTAVVEYATPSATDNSGETLSVECNPHSGSLFPIGKTTVTCATQDSNNNTGSCNFEVQITAACEIGWRLFGNSCYKKHTYIRVNYNEAEESCAGDGGHLASIHSESEQKFTDDMMLKDVPESELQYWIGFNDLQNEGSFVWTDQTQNQFTNWDTASDQPNEGVASEDCVSVVHRNNYNGLWHDASCSEEWVYICKKEANK